MIWRPLHFLLALFAGCYMKGANKPPRSLNCVRFCQNMLLVLFQVHFLLFKSIFFLFERYLKEKQREMKGAGEKSERPLPTSITHHQQNKPTRQLTASFSSTFLCLSAAAQRFIKNDKTLHSSGPSL